MKAETSIVHLIKPRKLSILSAKSIRNLLITGIAFIYAITLVNLPMLDFRDRINYLEYAASSPVIWQRYAEWGVFTLLANEPVWLLINILLGLWLEPSSVVRVIIGVSAFLVAWSLMRSSQRNMLWLLLMLLYPGIIKNFIIHLRQGCAIAVFLLGFWEKRNHWLGWVLMGLSPFIHSAFFPILFLLLASSLFKRFRVAADLGAVLFLWLTVVMIIALPSVGSWAGARQAFEYNLWSTPKISGLNFIFWLGMLFLMLSASRDFLREHHFQVGLIILYLGTYFTFYPSARIFENGLPIVLWAGLNLRGWRGRIFRWAVLIQGIFIWMFGFTSTLV